ncbi:MAG TPA: MBL fold metallo-hydrolase, partial [Burkholderiales bacterium]
MTEVVALPAFEDNYIWVIRNDGCAAVVDPGDAGPPLAYLRREDLRLVAILATHHHGDHV